MLNKSTEAQVKKVARSFFTHFPTLGTIRNARESYIVDKIEPLDLSNIKAACIRDLAYSLSDKDSVRNTIIGFPGTTAFAEESFQLFVRRKASLRSDNKEINRYVKSIMPVNELLDTIDADLSRRGSKCVVSGKKMEEIIGYEYEYSSTLFCQVCDDQEQYVKDKLITYKDALRNAILRIILHRNTRQAIVQFDQSLPLPNCTVSIQFQIRENVLYLLVFQRSQDILKVEMDCEIFNRMALEVIKEIEDVDEYVVRVYVGNMHRYLS
jgi:thymidylate synthase